ncbi:hypothetical protein [Proteocatella sphenisci]|uniref:hypothetical protein n=1 Tax=Proteocatella sphenisci TaxID=181070 RepID=UPI0004915D1B|nr:hypothetical protein [Proteocatella sphenisci]
MNKNQLRNTSIIFLLISSMVLLSIRFELFVSPSSTASTTFDAIGVEGILKSSVRPTSIIIRYTTNNVTKLVDKDGFYYQEARIVLRDSLSDISETSEISEVDYHEAKISKSIELDFEPAVNQRLLYGSLFLEDGSLGDFENIREILIPLVNDTSVYIMTEDAKFFRLANKTINYMPYVDNLSKLKYSKYYSLGELFDSSSDVLISDSGINIPSYETTSAFNEENSSSIPKSVFSSRYDFANRIQELDGTLITSNDYGRELLKMSPDGRVAYKNTDVLSNPVKNSMTSSLVIAYLFIDKFNVNNDVYVVEDVVDFSENGTNGYTFVFAPRIDGLRACLENNEVNTEVSVANGKVYSFKGIFRSYENNEDKPADDSDDYIFNALDVLNLNYDYIKSTVKFKDNLELFNKISLIDLVYVYGQDLSYTPAYKMIIAGKIFYFSTLNGEVI